MKYQIEKFNPAEQEAELKILIKKFKEYEAKFDSKFKTSDEAVNDLYETEMIGEQKHVYVVEDQGILIGFIAFEKSTKNDPLILEDVPAVYIGGLFIEDDYRGQGIAQELMKKAEEFAKSERIKYLKLLLFTKNQLARDFYFKSGFEDYETTMIKEV